MTKKTSAATAHGKKQLTRNDPRRTAFELIAIMFVLQRAYNLRLQGNTYGSAGGLSKQELADICSLSEHHIRDKIEILNEVFADLLSGCTGFVRQKKEEKTAQVATEPPAQQIIEYRSANGNRSATNQRKLFYLTRSIVGEHVLDKIAARLFNKVSSANVTTDKESLEAAPSDNCSLILKLSGYPLQQNPRFHLIFSNMCNKLVKRRGQNNGQNYLDGTSAQQLFCCLYRISTWDPDSLPLIAAPYELIVSVDRATWKVSCSLALKLPEQEARRLNLTPDLPGEFSDRLIIDVRDIKSLQMLKKTEAPQDSQPVRQPQAQTDQDSAPTIMIGADDFRWLKYVTEKEDHELVAQGALLGLLGTPGSFVDLELESRMRDPLETAMYDFQADKPTDSTAEHASCDFARNILLSQDQLHPEDEPYTCILQCTNLPRFFRWLKYRDHGVELKGPRLFKDLYRCSLSLWSQKFRGKPQEHDRQLLIVSNEASQYTEELIWDPVSGEEGFFDVNQNPAWIPVEQEEAVRLKDKVRLNLADGSGGVDFDLSFNPFCLLDIFDPRATLLTMVAKAVQQRAPLLLRVRGETEGYWTAFFPVSLQYESDLEDTCISGFKVIFTQDCGKSDDALRLCRLSLSRQSLQECRIYFGEISGFYTFSRLYYPGLFYSDLPAPKNPETGKNHGHPLCSLSPDNLLRPAETLYHTLPCDPDFAPLLHREEYFSLWMREEDLEILLVPEFIRILRCSYHLRDEKPVEGGKPSLTRRDVKLSCCCSEHEALRQWILDQGGKVRVLKNDLLKAEVEERAAQLLHAWQQDFGGAR